MGKFETNDPGCATLKLPASGRRTDGVSLNVFALNYTPVLAEKKKISDFPETLHEGESIDREAAAVTYGFCH